MGGWLQCLQVVTTDVFRQLFASVYVYVRKLQVIFFVRRGCASTALVSLSPCIFSDWRHHRAPPCLIASHWMMLTSSNISVLFSSQTVRAPRRSEAGFIMPVRHCLVCNPVFGRVVKYRCVQRTGSTWQWCDPFCLTVAKRFQHSWPTKGCWMSLTIAASAAFYTYDVGIAYQRQNCGTTSASPAHQHSLSKEGFVGFFMLQYVQRWSNQGPTSAHITFKLGHYERLAFRRLITNSRNYAFTGGFWNRFLKETSQVDGRIKNWIKKRLLHRTYRFRNSPTGK